MRNRSTLAALTLLALAAAPAFAPSVAIARPGGWGTPGWGSPGWSDGAGPERLPRSSRDRPGQGDRSREGRIEVNRFVGEGAAAQALGHGPIAVASQTEGQEYVAQGNRATFEAAVIDRLIHAGYDTTQAQPTTGQLAELKVTRTVLQPTEAPHKPVSGEVAMSVGNHGSAYGMAVNVDLTKPLPPLVSTRLEARIRDRVSGTILWEGRADVATREGDEKWSEQEIAARLSEALFDGFPRASDGIPAPHSDFAG